MIMISLYLRKLVLKICIVFFLKKISPQNLSMAAERRGGGPEPFSVGGAEFLNE